MAETVLLVDYDPRSVSRIRDLLTRAGLRVLLATDGEAGIEEFVRSKPDLVLVQDLLPKKHGFEVCNAVKGSEEGKKTPVVILGAKGNSAARRKTECDAFLGKPFQDAELLELLHKLVPRAFAKPTAKPAAKPAAKRRPGKPRAPRILVDFTEADVDERLDEVMASLAP